MQLQTDFSRYSPVRIDQSLRLGIDRLRELASRQVDNRESISRYTQKRASCPKNGQASSRIHRDDQLAACLRNLLLGYMAKLSALVETSRFFIRNANETKVGKYRHSLRDWPSEVRYERFQLN